LIVKWLNFENIRAEILYAYNSRPDDKCLAGC